MFQTSGKFILEDKMNRVYKIVNFEAGDSLYKFDDGQWVNYGKIVSDKGEMFGIRAQKFQGIIMLRKDLLYKEGFIASSYGLDNLQKEC